MPESTEAAVLSKDDIIAAIKSATGEVFSTMLGMDATAEEIEPSQNVAATPASGIIALIGLAGPWAGTGSISCDAEFACVLSGKFLMATYEAVNEEVLDAIAEITNMIIGNVKNTLEQKVGDMGLSTPTVIFGRNFQTRSARAHEWTGVKFICGAQSISVLMCLAPNKDAAAQKTLRPGFQFPQMLSM
jgi:chemotaxis protein CheX